MVNNRKFQKTRTSRRKIFTFMVQVMAKYSLNLCLNVIAAQINGAKVNEHMIELILIIYL